MLKDCCCCFSLKTGGLIIAGLGIFVAILYAGIGTFAGIQIIQASEEVINNNEFQGPALYINEQARVILVTIITGSIVSIVVCSLAIHGIHKKKHTYLLPWILLSLFGIFLGAFSILIVALFMLFNLQIGYFFAAILVGCLALSPSVYTSLIMYSLYKEIRDDISYTNASKTFYSVQKPC